MERKAVFVDTGAWYALADKSDRHHDEAVRVYPQLLRDYPSLTTTNLVVSETYVLIRRALGHGAAITFLDSVGTSPRIIRVCSDRHLEQVAEEILRKYEDQDFSYTDAVSFSVMRQIGITEAFAFDNHFVTAGFTLVP